jgi:hypothetical protein
MKHTQTYLEKELANQTTTKATANRTVGYTMVVTISSHISSDLNSSSVKAPPVTADDADGDEVDAMMMNED